MLIPPTETDVNAALVRAVEDAAAGGALEQQAEDVALPSNLFGAEIDPELTDVEKEIIKGACVRGTGRQREHHACVYRCVCVLLLVVVLVVLCQYVDMCGNRWFGLETWMTS